MFRLVVAQAMDLPFRRGVVSLRRGGLAKRELANPAGLSIGSLA